MGKLPIIKPQQMINYIKSIGFEEVRQKGSHKFFKHPDGRTACIPFHQNEDLGRGITSKILKDVKVSPEEFLNWL